MINKNIIKLIECFAHIKWLKHNVIVENVFFDIDLGCISSDHHGFHKPHLLNVMAAVKNLRTPITTTFYSMLED
jgi:hypothetical protein